MTVYDGERVERSKNRFILWRHKTTLPNDLNRRVVSSFNPNDEIGNIQSRDNGIKDYNQIYNDYNKDKYSYYCQSDGKLFDMNDLFYRVSIYRDKLSKQRKTRIAEALVSALKDLTNNIQNVEKKLEVQKRGIIKFKLIAGTYLPQFYRSTKLRILNELEKRHNLYINGHYIKSN